MATMRKTRLLQLLVGMNKLIIALLVVMSTVVDVHGITSYSPAPMPLRPDTALPTILILQQYEADALNGILKNWTDQNLNPQLSTVLNWSLHQHPCNSSVYNSAEEAVIVSGVSGEEIYAGTYEGAWSGVQCTATLQAVNATGNYYDVSVTSLLLYGSNSSCNCVSEAVTLEPPQCGIDCSRYSISQCGFDGIKGVLPCEIGRLINLVTLSVNSNPELTGPVPVGILQLPNLNALDLSNNNLTGILETNFSLSLHTMYLRCNQMSGVVDFRGLDCASLSSLYELDISHNHFSGTFFTGPYLNPGILDLSDNDFTGIKFANFTGVDTSRGPGTVYMPALYCFDARNNKLSGPIPEEIQKMPYLEDLYLGGNNLSGPVDFRVPKTLWIASIQNLDLSMNKFYGAVDFQGINETSNLYYLNISNNNFNETFFSGSYLNPTILDVSNNYFTNIIFTIYNGTATHSIDDYMPQLEELYIQNNNLRGGFPTQILKAHKLQSLYGGQNYFSDTLQLPDITLKNSNLTIISLVQNQFDYIQFPKNTGPFSKSILQVSNLLFLGGNPVCKKIDDVLKSTICRMNQSSLVLNVESKSNTKKYVIIITPISSIFLLILIVSTIYVWKLMNKIKSLHTILKEFERKEVKPNLYSYKEIKFATQNFDKKNKLGEGGFGVVYKGELFDGTIVAVKKLTMTSSQVLSDFLNEVVVISGLKHRNLVKLKGCCLGDGDLRILVFEYVENKNLAEALLMNGENLNNVVPQYLDWATRYNIIVGIARGLVYLHEELQSPIIHRDIKASNILLDKSYNPKIADFGLAYLFPTLENEATHLTLLQVAGTRGYCSPEYLFHGHISTALDVYGFGILMLEIVSGRKNIDLQKSEDEVCLREWAWRKFEEQQSLKLIDLNMAHTAKDLEALKRVVNIALSCVHYKPIKRPKMHDVVCMLLGNMPVSDFHEGFEYGEPLEEHSG